MKIKNIMKSRVFCGLLVGALCISLSGCATMFSGTRQNVKFRSYPSGAKIVVDGKEYTTPAEVKLPRKRFHVATFSKDGYDTAEFVIRRKPNNLALLDVAWSVFIPIGLLVTLLALNVDTKTGGAFWLDTDDVNVKLTPTAPQRTISIELLN